MRTQYDYSQLAHERRAAAYGEEIATSLGLSFSDSSLLKKAIDRELNLNLRMSGPGLSRLVEEMGLGMLPEPVPSYFPSEFGPIAELVRHFDQEMEFAAYDDVLLEDRLQNAAFDPYSNPAIAFVLPKLRRCSKQDLIQLVPKLPVFPGYVLEVIRQLRREDVSVERILKLASQDQVLATGLIACANSAANSPTREITNLVHAVTYIGTDRAAMIVTALALKPFIFTAGSGDLWAHSLRSAAAAEALSEHCNLPKADAFLLGLVHDIGRLLLTLIPPQASAARRRLVNNGCETAIAELVVCGTDHAGAGALVLDHWRFPAAYVEAVRFHHEPQATDSKLAALLYLVEFWTESNEDPASQVRLNAALERLSLSEIFVTKMRVPKATSPFLV
jgi:HD-like signal output (HDOD) protein